MQSLPEISLGTAALIIFGLCACSMVIRGLARTIVNTAFLTFSAWVGFRVWQQAPELALQWTGGTSPLITTGLPIIAFLATLLILRKIVKFFRAPLSQEAGEVRPRSFGHLLFRLLVTLVPAGLLCITIATLIHHAGSIAEIRDSTAHRTTARATTQPSIVEPSTIERLKNAISLAIPASLMDKLDPFASQPRLELAKMIAASSQKKLEAVINPETGQPYPRAIIVDNPELLDLAKAGRFSTLLRHPLLSEAMNDPKIRQALGL